MLFVGQGKTFKFGSQHLKNLRSRKKNLINRASLKWEAMGENNEKIKLF